MKTTMRGPRQPVADVLVAATPGWMPAVGPDARQTAAELAGAPVFSGMEPDEVAAVLSAFAEAHYPRQRRVVLEGLRGSDFFLIVEGTASVLVDGWRVARLGPGDFFGEMAVLGDGLRTASVRADAPLRCLVLPNGSLEPLLLEHPQLGVNLLRCLVGRFAGVSGLRQPPAAEMVPA